MGGPLFRTAFKAAGRAVGILMDTSTVYVLQSA